MADLVAAKLVFRLQAFYSTPVLMLQIRSRKVTRSLKVGHMAFLPFQIDNQFFLLKFMPDNTVWVAETPVGFNNSAGWVQLAPLPGGLFGKVIGFSQSIQGIGPFILYIEDPQGQVHRMLAEIQTPNLSPSMISWQGWQAMGQPPTPQ